MKIQVIQTLPNGQVTQQVLSKEGSEVLKIQAQPGAKISFNVEGAKPAEAMNAKAKTSNIKKSGKNLVLESEGEALVEVTDFYSTADASVGNVSWNYAAGDAAAMTATPVAQALASDAAVSESGALLPVIASGWLAAGGAAVVAAVASGGGSSAAAVAGGGGVVASNVVSGVITAGPLISGHGLSVVLYKADGTTQLGTAQVDINGKFSKDVGSYTGVIIAQVIDSGTGKDYADEASGVDVNLSSHLMAVGVMTGGALKLNINPLTAIAAQKAGLSGVDGSGLIATTTDASDANAAVAKAFGLPDITQTDPDTTNDTVAGSNAIGAVLAALSGLDAFNGNAQTTINNLASVLGITAAGVLTTSAQTAVLQGAAIADSGGTLGLVNKVSDTLTALANSTTTFTIKDIDGIVATVANTFADNIISSTENGAIIRISGTMSSGTTGVSLSINGAAGVPATVDSLTNTWYYDAAAGSLGADGVRKIAATATLASGTATAERLYVVNATDDAPLAVSLANQNLAILENATTANGIKIADIVIADMDGYASGAPTVSDSTHFEVKLVSGKYELWLKAGVVLNHVTAASYAGLTVTAQGVSSAAFNVTVTDVNNAPTGTSSNITILEDVVGGRAFTSADFGFVDAADSPVNTLATVIITTLPTAGTLKLNGVDVTQGQSIAAADLPHLIYAPALNGNGTGYASIGFKVQDAGGTANGGVDTSATDNTLTINVTAVNDTPERTGTPTAVTVNEDSATNTATSLGLSSISYGAGGGSDESTQTLTVTMGTVPSFITLYKADGTTAVATGATLTVAELQGLTYKTVANQFGAGSVTWTVADNGTPAGSLGSQSVSVTVTSVNDTPTSTVTQGFTTTASASATFNQIYSYDAKTALGFADVEDTTLTYTLGSNAPSWMTINSSGVISGTAPVVGSTGAPLDGDHYTVTVRATDSGTPALYVDRDVLINIYNNPQVMSIARATTEVGATAGSGNTSSTTAVDFLITFNKSDLSYNSVDTVQASDFTVTFTPSSGGASSAVSASNLSIFGSGLTRTLTVSGTAVAALGDGTLAITAVSGITDSSNNAINNALPTGSSNQAYVLDHVNQAPAFTSSATATVIAETVTGTATIYTAAVTDPDLTTPNKSIQYLLGSGGDSASFTIDQSSGAVYLTTGNYNYESKQSYSFDVIARDLNGGVGANSVTRTVTLAINDVNEAPQLIAQTANVTNAITGEALTTIAAGSAFTDPDTLTASFHNMYYDLSATFGGNAVSLATAGLSINHATGSITGTPTASGTFALTVTAWDGGAASAGLSAIETFNLTATARPALTSSQSLAAATGADATTHAALDVRSALVLNFDQNIAFNTATGVRHIHIYDDMGTAGLITHNPSFASGIQSVQDVTDNDVDITITDGVVTGVMVGTVDYTLLGGGGATAMTQQRMMNSATISGSKLIIDIGGGDVASNAFNFDWDFGANYHVAFDAGLVVGTTSGVSSVGFGSSTAGTGLAFTTVTPAMGSIGSASQIQSIVDGSLSSSFIWHSANQGDPVTTGQSAATPLDFSSGMHALVSEASATTLNQAYTAALKGVVNVSGFGLNDLLYTDNNGNMAMHTSQGEKGATWAGAASTTTAANATVKRSDSGNATVEYFADYGTTTGPSAGYTISYNASTSFNAQGDIYFEGSHVFNKDLVVFG
jgi:hypothetical protein